MCVLRDGTIKLKSSNITGKIMIEHSIFEHAYENIVPGEKFLNFSSDSQ